MSFVVNRDRAQDRFVFQIIRVLGTDQARAARSEESIINGEVLKVIQEILFMTYYPADAIR